MTAMHRFNSLTYCQDLERAGMPRQLAEVQALHARGDLHPGLPSVRCVGYRQLWSVLEGELDLKQAREQAISATRQLAKRQITWLRSQPERHMIDACSPTATDQVIQAISKLTE
jgi:tRNA dimethylallyltransferase